MPYVFREPISDREVLGAQLEKSGITKVSDSLFETIKWAFSQEETSERIRACGILLLSPFLLIGVLLVFGAIYWIGAPLSTLIYFLSKKFWWRTVSAADLSSRLAMLRWVFGLSIYPKTLKRYFLREFDEILSSYYSLPESKNSENVHLAERLIANDYALSDNFCPVRRKKIATHLLKNANEYCELNEPTSYMYAQINASYLFVTNGDTKQALECLRRYGEGLLFEGDRNLQFRRRLGRGVYPDELRVVELTMFMFAKMGKSSWLFELQQELSEASDPKDALRFALDFVESKMVGSDSNDRLGFLVPPDTTLVVCIISYFGTAVLTLDETDEGGSTIFLRDESPKKIAHAISGGHPLYLPRIYRDIRKIVYSFWDFEPLFDRIKSFDNELRKVWSEPFRVPICQDRELGIKYLADHLLPLISEDLNMRQNRTVLYGGWGISKNIPFSSLGSRDEKTGVMCSLNSDYGSAVFDSFPIFCDKEPIFSIHEPSFFMANPTGDLPCSEVECILASRRKDVVRFGSEVDKKMFVTDFIGGSVLHFSGHGVVDWGTPQNSGLLCSGRNVLNVSDITEMNRKIDCQLFVLSACETLAVNDCYDPYGANSIARVLCCELGIMVVGTSWKVPDFQTCLFMMRFYENVFEEKQNPVSALAKTKAWCCKVDESELLHWFEDRISQSGGEDLLFFGENATAIEQMKKVLSTMGSGDTPIRPLDSISIWGAFEIHLPLHLNPQSIR